MGAEKSSSIQVLIQRQRFDQENVNLRSDEDKNSLKRTKSLVSSHACHSICYKLFQPNVLVRYVRHYFIKSTKGYNMTLWPSLHPCKNKSESIQPSTSSREFKCHFQQTPLPSHLSTPQSVSNKFVHCLPPP